MVRSFRDSGEAKESKQQGTKASRSVQRQRGRQAGKALRERRLAGTGKSDVSKYDDRLAAAIRDVDFRNSPIGRSLLADDFQRGDITVDDFARLQDIQQNPGDRTLAERRQINTVLGLNPTAGMGILDGLRSGFQGQQFEQEKRRLQNLTSLSPVRQAISSLFGRRTDDFPTTDQVFGVSAEEDARLRALSNPDVQNLIFDRFLDDFGDTAPEQVITDPIIDAPTTQVGEQPNISQVDLGNIAGPAIGAGILAAAAAPRLLGGAPRSGPPRATARGIPGVLTSAKATPRSGPPRAVRFPGSSVSLPAAGTGVMAASAAKAPSLFNRFLSSVAKPLAFLGSLPASTAAFALSPTELAAADFQQTLIQGCLIIQEQTFLINNANI